MTLSPHDKELLIETINERIEQLHTIMRSLRKPDSNLFLPKVVELLALKERFINDVV